jgi:ATP-binding cassette, subfamily C, type I secretion system permease/ATPase
VTGEPAPLRSLHPGLAAALTECRKAFLSVALFSGVVNMLMLAGPIYMLQVYDRVLASRSVPTLVALSLLLVLAYGFQGGLELVRSRLVVRIASLLDLRLDRSVYDAVIRLANQKRNAAEAQQPTRDLDQIRAFLTGPGPIALVDLPWAPIFLAICALIHPWLGVTALVGALSLLVLTLLTQRRSRAPVLAMTNSAAARSAALELTRRNSETIVAMGMADTLAQRWRQVNGGYLSASTTASDVVGSFGSVSRVLRMLLQSAMLGIGAYLVIQQELSAGAMIAASIMMGRALAPIEIAIANWRSLVAARQSLRRLSSTLSRLPTRPARTDLPAPVRSLSVEHVVVAAPGSSATIVANVHFELSAGEALAVVGPSGAGKTSLVRTLIAAWTPARGEIRLDGAALDQWNEDAFGRHTGYVGQQVEFFEDTVKESFAHMLLAPDAGAVLAAGRAAGAHEMILHLPGGYDSRIGEATSALSAGQRQRIALARALYGDPFLVVLDEPNANLDSEGEAVLQTVLQELKARGAIVVIVSHRPSALDQCDKVLVLSNGAQQVFGPREAIVRKTVARLPRPATAGNLALLRQDDKDIGS